MNQVAIVIGATGLVGKALVKQLTEAGHISKIITLTRRVETYTSAKVYNHVVDFDHLDKHKTLFKADLLFSCLGTTLKQAGTIEAQRKVDLSYQLKSAQLAADSGVEHYLLVSSTGANSLSGSSYLKMKGQLEEQVKMLPFKHITILQPSLLIGPREHFRFGERAAAWLMPVLCTIPGLRRFSPITGKQVAAKMLAASLQPSEPLCFYRLDELFVD
jgi:uncharacterized protein YbjT (DUF2867 family)